MKKVILKLTKSVNHSDLRNLSVINTIDLNQKSISQIKIFVNRNPNGIDPDKYETNIIISNLILF